jgi:hypothetical protein
MQQNMANGATCRGRNWVTAMALVSVLFGTPLQAETSPEEPARAPLPRNMAIDDELRDTVEETAALSPTLRRQFAVIASTPVVVEVRVSPVPLLGLRRAQTEMSRYDTGFIRARVVVPSGIDFVELLAHELEHVLEQIERVDLAALARAGLANRDGDGSYETVRARDAGRAAAAEVEQGQRALNAAH